MIDVWQTNDDDFYDVQQKAFSLTATARQISYG
jgi:hypothetical protein